MKWEKFTKDNLPPVGEKVLIWYKSGFFGATEFFCSEEQKKGYIEGMTWFEENPEGYSFEDPNPFQEFLLLAQKWSMEDPITHWAMVEKPKKMKDD